MGAIGTLTVGVLARHPDHFRMSVGATDGSYLRNAGIRPTGTRVWRARFGDNRAHGRDERVLVKSFWKARSISTGWSSCLAGGK